MRRTKKPLTGRMKPCAACGKDFYCHKSQDVGGTLPEAKYCDRKCYHAGIRYSPQRAQEAFWSRVNKDGPNGCWLYMGARDKWGYGDIGYLGKHIQAHRLAWILLREYPGGMFVLHKCHNPPCCNPDHLYLGNDADNTRDKVEARRHSFGERNSHAKLTEAEVLAIRAEYRYENRRSNVLELCAKYGVSDATITGIASRRIWRHL